jgi:hypothetical protein
VRDLVLSVVAASALAALGLAALAALTLAPFVAALQVADARHRSAARCGAAARAGSGAALTLALVLLLKGVPPAVAGLLALVVAWAVPAAVWRSPAGDRSRIGAHQ